MSGFDVNGNQKKEAPPEQMLDYLVNLNKLLRVKSLSYKKKFLRWKEMNFFKVSQELKKEFEQLQKIQREVDVLDGGMPGLSPFQVEEMFQCFDQLVEVKNVPKSLRNLKNFSQLESRK